MDSNTATRLFSAIIAITFSGAARSAISAEPPSADQALSLKPILEREVDFTIPSKEEAAQCVVRLEHEGKASCWVVRNRQGEILRRLFDTNNDNIVDTWCYYSGGVEVYRDIDSDYNGHADQYRWFNTAGTRWAVDKNEDQRVDYWKVISPHEVAEQVVLALKNHDQARFELLLLTPGELNGLGFGPPRADTISESIKAAPAKFSKLAAEQTTVKSQTRHVDFSSARPGTIPIGTAGSTKDVTICDNATALVQTDDKHDQVSIGTLISVGDTWKLIDVPPVTNDNQPTGGLLTGPVATSPNNPAGDNQPSDKMQKLMAELERLDKEGDAAPPEKVAANIEQRVTTLQNLADATPEKDRDQWYRQMADVLGMGIQSGNYPQGVERLEELEKKLTDAKADQELIAHAAFQRMWAQFAVSQHDPSVDAGKLQEKWLADLQAFVEKYPKCADAAEALFQLGMYQEFMGKAQEAAKWYQQLVTTFPKAGPVEKATGALRRLNSLGKPISLRGTDAQGAPVDLAKYRGKAVLIHYWTTLGQRWKEDMILLRDTYAKKGGRDFEIIGVCLDEEPSNAKQYVAENKLRWKQIYERGGLDGRLANEMGVLTLPLMILVDQKGNVANQNIHVAEVESELAKLSKPTTDTANALRGAPTSR